MTRKTPSDAAPEAIPAAAPEREPAVAQDGCARVSPPPSPRQYRRRLANHANVRTALADVLRKLEGDELGDKKARALIYGFAVLAGVISDERKLGELEERLAAVEARAAGGFTLPREGRKA